MDRQTAAYYSQNAARLVGKYARVETGYLEKITAVFQDCGRVLDVGCGTGRDCLHLLRSGKDAIGVDASVEMLAQARATFQSEGIECGERLVEASLPKLLPIEDGAFDGVLCAGVLMHLLEEEIFDAVFGLKRVLRHGGVLAVSIPEFRPGIDSVSRRDESGRLFIDLPPDKLQLLFERVGFRIEDSFSSADSLGRQKTTWRTMVLRRLDHASDRPLHQVEGILNRDQKVATYKLALFRALAEIAQTQPHLARFTNDQKVTIPNYAIAEKWLLYYWPIFENEMMIAQGTSSAGADVAIRTPMIPLIAHYTERGGFRPSTLSGVAVRSMRWLDAWSSKRSAKSKARFGQCPPDMREGETTKSFSTIGGRNRSSWTQNCGVNFASPATGFKMQQSSAGRNLPNK